MEQLAREIFSVLRTEEDNWDISDSVTHPSHPERGKTEAFWCDAIRNRLGHPGCSVWPGEWPCHNGIDLAFEFVDGRRCCVEVKGLWPTYWLKRRQVGMHKTNLFYPLDPNLSRKSNTVALDLRRLALRSEGATQVGLLIVGSFIPDRRTFGYDLPGDLDRFARMANLTPPHWSMERLGFPNRRAPGYEYEFRFWWCSKENISQWWPSISRFYDGEPQAHRVLAGAHPVQQEPIDDAVLAKYL